MLFLAAAGQERDVPQAEFIKRLPYEVSIFGGVLWAFYAPAELAHEIFDPAHQIFDLAHEMFNLTRQIFYLTKNTMSRGLLP